MRWGVVSMETGSRLRKLRIERGLSQEELADLFQITAGTISNWERGSRKPDLIQLNNLADHFGVSSDYLLCRTNERNPEVKQFHTPKDNALWRKFADLFEPGSIDWIEFAIELKENEIDPEEIRDYL